MPSNSFRPRVLLVADDEGYLSDLLFALNPDLDLDLAVTTASLFDQLEAGRHHVVCLDGALLRSWPANVRRRFARLCAATGCVALADERGTDATLTGVGLPFALAVAKPVEVRALVSACHELCLQVGRHRMQAAPVELHHG